MRFPVLVPSVLAFCLLPGAEALAQEAAVPAPAGAPLTLAEAVAEALAANPDLTAARAASRAADARPEIERGLRPPMFEGEIFSWPLDTANPADAQFMVTMQQELPGRGKRALRAARASEEAAFAANEVEVRRVRVVTGVKGAFVRLLAGRRIVDLLDESMTLVQQLGAAAEVKYAAGRSSQQEVVKALIERTRLQRDQVAATEQVRLAEAELNALLGRAPSAPIGPLVPPPRPALPAAEVAQATAREHQPELLAPKIDARVADAELAAIASERKPDWIVGGGYMVMPDQTNALTARVGITWPGAPWSSSRIDAEQREAQARRAAADARSLAAENETRRATQEAWVRARAAQERESVVRDALLPQARHALELARLGYESDRASFLDVIEAARTVLDVRRDLIGVETERDLALVALELAMGSEVPATPGPGTPAPGTAGSTNGGVR
jgi:outer membrane protein, heavy metal efflux system